MASIFSGIAIAVGLAVVAAFALSEAQKPSYEHYETQSIRIGDPGSNLVGSGWSGNPQEPHSDL